jgi:CBS domain-containing protein
MIVTTQFSENYPLWQRIVLGLVVSILLLTTSILREYIVASAAFRKEIPINKITLYIFGGVYRENRAIIFSTHLPLLYLIKYTSNLLIAIIFYGLYATFINTGNLMLAVIAQWIAYIYFLLFLIHFIPAFPLDGGQILRIILFKSTGDYNKATYTASFVGWAIGLFFIFIGVLVLIVTNMWIISLVIVSLGWILQIAAGNTRRQIEIHMVLKNIHAGDIMSREYPSISSNINIGQLIREYILLHGWHYVIVVEGAKLIGIVSLGNLKSLPANRWNNTNITDIMTPYSQIKTTHPQETADTLFEEMYQHKSDYIPVLQDNNIIGVVTLDSLKDSIKIRSTFGL